MISKTIVKKGLEDDCDLIVRTGKQAFDLAKLLYLKL